MSPGKLKITARPCLSIPPWFGCWIFLFGGVLSVVVVFVSFAVVRLILSLGFWGFCFVLPFKLEDNINGNPWGKSWRFFPKAYLTEFVFFSVEIQSDAPCSPHTQVECGQETLTYLTSQTRIHHFFITETAHFHCLLQGW